MNTYDIDFFKENGMKITEGTFEWFPLSESKAEIRMLPDEFVIDIRYNESDKVSQWTVGEANRVLITPWRHTKSWRPSMSNFKELEEAKTYRYEKVTDSIFDLKEEFERGELFSFDGGECYVQIETEGDFSYAHVHENLYRRIEVTERELELEAAYELYCEFRSGNNLTVCSIDNLHKESSFDFLMFLVQKTGYRKSINDVNGKG